MRIALLTNDSPPQIGGISHYLGGLVRSTSGPIEWQVWSTVPGAEPRAWNCPVEAVDTGRHLGKWRGDNIALLRKLNSVWWRWVKRRWAVALLARIRDTFQPDLVVIARWCEDGHHWCRACQHWGIRYALIGHGLEFRESQPRFPWNVAGALREDWMRADCGFANSRATLEVMLGKGIRGDHCHVLHPGLVPEDLEGIEGEKPPTAMSGWAQRPFILALGRLVYRKGFDLAIRAFESVAGEFPDVQLVVAGDGPERANLEGIVRHSSAGKQVILTGNISNGEKRWLLENCQLFLMPNRPVEGDMEGFGIVFLEAGWFGKPVIGGNNGGVPEAIDAGRTGWCVVSPDLGEIAEKLRRLLRDDGLRQRMGQAGREWVTTNYLWPALGARFLAVLHSGRRAAAER